VLRQALTSGALCEGKARQVLDHMMCSSVGSSGSSTRIAATSLVRGASSSPPILHSHTVSSNNDQPPRSRERHTHVLHRDAQVVWALWVLKRIAPRAEQEEQHPHRPRVHRAGVVAAVRAVGGAGPHLRGGGGRECVGAYVCVRVRVCV